MSKVLTIIFSVLIIGTFCLQLVSCAGKPKRYLDNQASWVKPGDSKDKVLDLLGPPDARKASPSSLEEWYYYNKKRRFWNKIPLLGSHLGGQQEEILLITFKNNVVSKVLYYEPD